MSDPIQNAIIAHMKQVKGIGQVFAYEPYHRQMQDLISLYLVGGKINGWSVLREAVVETPATIGTIGVFQNSEKIDWKILGFREITEPGDSALLFNETVDALRDVFRNNRTLSTPGITTVFDERAGLELIDAGLAQFGGAICHTAVLGLTTERRI